MPDYRIGGINVEFPYNAYDCQLVYMERVIHALQQGSNALLESPTGTGKTLCLLCATLAWRQSFKPAANHAGRELSSPNESTLSQGVPKSKLPTILYASRTHSQLQQVIRELKATTYRPKMIVLGSREQMCIHKDVQSMRGKAQNHTCRSLVKERKCHHHNRVPDYMKSHPEIGKEPVDIEDLISIGKAHGPCPYYLSRELHSSADILFLPYNYLIDKDNRRSLTGIDWERTILIFDEAHNLEGLCADAASFDLPASHLTACIGEARKCVELAISHRGMDNAADTSMDPDNFAVLKALLLELEKRINEIPMDSSELGFTRPGSYMYEFLATMKINWQTATILIDTIEQATSLLEDEAATRPGMGTRSSGTAYRLLAFRDALKLIFGGTETSNSTCYKVHIQEVRNKDGDKGAHRGAVAKVSRTLSWWCFNPGIAMEEFAKMGVRSVILTSGTLAPLDSFASELKLPFNVRLENPHVIDSSQIWVGVVPSGPSGRPLNSSYKTRDSPEYKLELGNTIVNFARIIPDGLLVFFPSYYLLNSCIDTWQSLAPGTSVNSSTIWERISKFKQPVVEPKESALFNQANESFMAKLLDTSSSGAVFFAVCRGKVSEGLDFADRTGRGVVVTGIPYAMKTDPKIRLKREYLDEAIRSNPSKKKGITGEEWYVQQAARAVNQAVGRVIRHRNDYGAILLCDERFAQGNSQSQMSLWLRPHIKCYSKFGDAAFTLTRFFRDKGGADLPVFQKSLKVGAPESVPQHVRGNDRKEVEATINNALSMSHTDIKSSGLKERWQGQIADIRGANTSISTGQIMGLFYNGFPGSSGPCQPLSEMLAVRKAQFSNQSLNSVAIIKANCAVGSTTGFVNGSRNRGSQIQLPERVTSAQDRHKDVGVTCPVLQMKSTLNSESKSDILPNVTEQDHKVPSSMCHTSIGEVRSSSSLKKRQLEPVEKPWSLNKHITRDNPIMHNSTESPLTFEGNPTGRNPGNNKSGSNNVPDNAARGQGEVGEQMAKACTGEGNDPNLCSAEQVQQTCQTDAQMNNHMAMGSASNQKTKNAAGFLREVKAHLSVVEYTRFLECMRDLKNQLMSMASLLKAVSNLFSAPERLFLLRRFGDFIPSQHRQLYEECLAARCAELGYPFDCNNSQADHRGGGENISRGSSLKPCFTSKRRKLGTNKRLDI